MFGPSEQALTGTNTFTDVPAGAATAEFVLLANGAIGGTFQTPISPVLADGATFTIAANSFDWKDEPLPVAKLISQSPAGNLRDVFFIDSNTGWAVGENGTVIKTTDSGSSRTVQDSGTTNDLWSVSFVDANTGYATGDDNTNFFIKTTDGGQTWTSGRVLNARGFRRFFLAIEFLTPDIGLIAGVNVRRSLDAEVYYTADGGDSWALAFALDGPRDQVFYALASDGANVIAASDRGRIARSIASGAPGSWTSVGTNINRHEHQEHPAALRGRNGYVVGLDGFSAL